MLPYNCLVGLTMGKTENESMLAFSRKTYRKQGCAGEKVGSKRSRLECQQLPLRGQSWISGLASCQQIHATNLNTGKWKVLNLGYPPK